MKEKKSGTQIDSSATTTKKKRVDPSVGTKKKKRGRPTDYTKELGEKICGLMCDGKSVRAIGKMKGMPDAATIFRWAITNEEFYEQYAKAREVQAEKMFEEIIDISDETHGIIKSGAEKKSGAYANGQRLRVDVRKWYLSKVLPKKFGDRQSVVTEDKDGNVLPISGNAITFVNSDGSSKSA